jgi:RNA polymerase sigma factor (sigma-70 family)
VEIFDGEAASALLRPDDDAARKRAAVEIYAHNEAALRRAAQRFSLCADDAEDALQRGLEILLRKAPTDDPRQLIKWMQTVIRHEALAIRRERERTLAGPAATKAEPGREDWVALLPASADGPPERAERQEAVGRWREALRALKPQELRALTLLAEGYSYVEIGEITGYSQTKVNRCLAEGRERFRTLVARSEDGGRCAEMRPLLSAFCDGEAEAGEVAELREHLRACAQCRATLRTYRAAPSAAAVLVPYLPLPRSLWERAQDAFGDLFGRFGSGGETVSQAAAGSGAGGVAAAVKIAAVCVGAASGAAACVAGGLVPTPLDLGGGSQRPRIERQLSKAPTARAQRAQVEYAPAPAPEPKPNRSPKSPSPSRAPAEVEPAAAEPAADEGGGGAAEYVPPPSPEPVAEPSPSSSSGTGSSPAGEFGP